MISPLPPKKGPLGNHGQSIAGVLMTLFVAFFVTVQFTAMERKVKRTWTAQSILKKQHDRKDLKRYFNEQANWKTACSICQSRSPTSIQEKQTQGKSYLTISDQQGEPLIQDAAQGTSTIGKFQVRAHCENGQPIIESRINHQEWINIFQGEIRSKCSETARNDIAQQRNTGLDAH